MRKLVVGAFVTLDGVMQAPKGPNEKPQRSNTPASTAIAVTAPTQKTNDHFIRSAFTSPSLMSSVWKRWSTRLN